MDILGINIDKSSIEEIIRKISTAVMEGEVLRIVTANPELIYNAQKDRELREIINSADLILPDGIGVVWAARQLGESIAERVTGIDLTMRILEEGNRRGWRIFFLGARPGVGEKAVLEQKKNYPKIAFGCHHGYFTKEEESIVLERISRFAPDILLTGLGAPKQEYFNAANPGLAKVLIGVGGSIDVLSGEVKRAPQFFVEHHLEWLYRLVTEPSRLKRQTVLPLYVIKILRRKFFN